MFIGHYAIGLAAKKAAPKVSLGTLFISVQLLDLLWPLFLLLGIEHVRIVPSITAFSPLDLYDYPISHSLVMSLIWSLALALIYFAARRYKMGAWIVAAGVFSHWILDFITHRPDMPIMPASQTYVGLGLWNSVPATILVESAMYIAGVVLYARSTTAIDRLGKYAFWALVVFLGISYVMSIVAGPPPSEQAIAIGGLSLWLIVLWGYWIDRHRRGTHG